MLLTNVIYQQNIYALFFIGLIPVIFTLLKHFYPKVRDCIPDIEKEIEKESKKTKNITVKFVANFYRRLRSLEKNQNKMKNRLDINFWSSIIMLLSSFLGFGLSLFNVEIYTFSLIIFLFFLVSGVFFLVTLVPILYIVYKG